MNDMRDDILQIPDYQRDSDQWDDSTKSLLVESIINNLSIPAFFFEVILEKGVEKNQVVDGQQRLTTLYDFFKNKLRLVDAQDAAYISPHHALYANRTFDELPPAYQQAFKKYRLTVIKLRNLDDMRLEVFRRINQGGTPLSGQDIRLAYYGEKSPSLAFIRLAGIYLPNRQAAGRFLKTAKEVYGIEFPWTSKPALEAWADWWEDKEIARGQVPSETFLWSLVTAQVGELNTILNSADILRSLNVRFNRGIDEALDAYAAQLSWQDKNPAVPEMLMGAAGMRDKFFPYFERVLGKLLNEKGPNINVTKSRLVASVIGAAFRMDIDDSKLTDRQWGIIVEFIRRPKEIAATLGVEWPQSKGKWDGGRGYYKQLCAVYEILKAALKF
jgi:hypothetical protein